MPQRNTANKKHTPNPTFKGFKVRGEGEKSRKMTFAYTVTPPLPKDDIVVGYESYTPYTTTELTEMFMKKNVGP